MHIEFRIEKISIVLKQNTIDDIVFNLNSPWHWSTLIQRLLKFIDTIVDVLYLFTFGIIKVDTTDEKSIIHLHFNILICYSFNVQILAGIV